MSKISVIIPCYYNEHELPITLQRLLDNEKEFPDNTLFEYVMVDDGSGDNTYAELLKHHVLYPEKIKVIKLVQNVGSYNAITVGMKYATGNCCTVISADLQDPPEIIQKMFAYWQKGVKLVIANRQDRNDPLMGKIFSTIFQYTFKKYALKRLPKGGYDFVLFDEILKQQVLDMKEKNTNILYLLLWLGYDYVNIPYVRQARAIGKSRWTVSKKIKLFIDSFVAFSYFPIRLISVLGLIMGISALGYASFIIVGKLLGLVPVQGWSSLMIVILFASSFQMIALGIIGEYLWRTLDQVRNRPGYIIEKEHL